MPNHSKGARLYLYRRKGRSPIYVIRDGAREKSTSYGPENVAEANEALKDYLADHFAPDTKERRLNRIVIGEVLMMYMQSIPDNSPSRATRGYHIQNLARFWGDKTLDQVKGSTCRGYLEARSGKQSGKNERCCSTGLTTGSVKSVTPSTVRLELKTLQTAINHWHRESPLAAVPKVSLPPASGPKERVLSRNEVARMLWACRRLSRRKNPLRNGGYSARGFSHVARFIIIGIYTGTRHAATLALKWERSLSGGHIDIEKNG
jgi:integrase